jgi:hypothetical protein
VSEPARPAAVLTPVCVRTAHALGACTGRAAAARMRPPRRARADSVQAILRFQRLTREAMYRRIARALKQAGSQESPTDFLVFFCLGNREAGPQVRSAGQLPRHLKPPCRSCGTRPRIRSFLLSSRSRPSHIAQLAQKPISPLADLAWPANRSRHEQQHVATGAAGGREGRRGGSGRQPARRAQRRAPPRDDLRALEVHGRGRRGRDHRCAPTHTVTASSLYGVYMCTSIRARRYRKKAKQCRFRGARLLLVS